MMLLALIFLLAQAIASQAISFTQTTRPGDDIAALCAGKNIDLTKLSDLEALSERAEGTPSCTAITKKALVDLKSLIEQGSKDLCSVESIDKLRDYYTEYLDTSETASHTELLPKSLRRFALAYGMQMSNQCKQNMIRVLSEDAPKLVTQADFEMFGQVTSDKNPIAKVLAAIGKFPDEVIFPVELAPLFERFGYGTKRLGEDKLFIQSATAPLIRRLQAVCQRRFQPIYEPLLAPLTRLANMGFDYKDDPLRCKLRCSDVVGKVRPWSRIVLFCESLNSFELIEEQEDKMNAEGTDTKLVRVMTKAEAAAITGNRLGLDGNDRLADIKPIVYQPASVELVKPHIYDKNDAKLKRAIRKFKTGRNLEDKTRKRMLKVAGAYFKIYVKSSNVRVVTSSAFRDIVIKRQKIDHPLEQMVKVLNEMVEQEIGNQDAPVALNQTGFNIIATTGLIIFIIIVVYIFLYALFLGIAAAAAAFG